MKNIVGMAISALLLSASGAFSGTVDFVPTKLTFTKYLTDDVSMSYAQRVSIHIKNVGTQAYTNALGSQIKVRVGTWVKDGSIYGPPNTGYIIGGQINPGQSGHISFYLPLDTLKHCNTYFVKIDTIRTVQVGSSAVFNNDSKNLIGTDLKAITACAVGMQKSLKVVPNKNLVIQE